MDKELTERQKGLLTLIVDKMNHHGYMMGAHKNGNWLTTPKYATIGSDRMQGTLDRIGKIEYHRTFHVDEVNYNFMNPKRLGPDVFDHSIYCVWKELFGKGQEIVESDTLRASMLQDKAGRWHYPCDQGFHISLWHPSKQRSHEKVSGRWDLKEPPHWRPVYHYDRYEVIEALKLMCETFGWEFEEGTDSEWMIMH